MFTNHILNQLGGIGHHNFSKRERRWCINRKVGAIGLLGVKSYAVL